jgi:acetyl-CoA carboxylase beta subunit
MTSEFFAQHGGIHAVVKRQEIKSIIAGVLRMTAWYRELKGLEDFA